MEFNVLIFLGLALLYTLKALYLFLTINSNQRHKNRSREISGFSDWLAGASFVVLVIGAFSGGIQYAIPPAVFLASMFLYAFSKSKVHEKHSKINTGGIEKVEGNVKNPIKSKPKVKENKRESPYEPHKHKPCVGPLESVNQEQNYSFVVEDEFANWKPIEREPSQYANSEEVITNGFIEDKKEYFVEPKKTSAQKDVFEPPNLFDEWVPGQKVPEATPLQSLVEKREKVKPSQVIPDDDLPFSIPVIKKESLVKVANLTYDEIVQKIMQGTSITGEQIVHKSIGMLSVLDNDKRWVYFKIANKDGNAAKLERKFRASDVLSNGLFSYENQILTKPKDQLKIVQKSAEEAYEISTKSTRIKKPSPVNESTTITDTTISVSDAFKEHGQIYVYHMTHIDNIFGILDHGLLSHENAHSRGFTRVDISDKVVNDRRKNNDTIYHKSIHSYVPLYLNPKNPMSSKRRDEDYILFRFKISDLENRTFIFTDGNASSDRTYFYKSSKYVENLPWDVIHAGFWKDFEDSTRKRCSEMLISTRIPETLIDSIIVKNQIHKNWLSTNCKKVKNFEVKIDSNLFF